MPASPQMFCHRYITKLFITFIEYYRIQSNREFKNLLVTSGTFKEEGGRRTLIGREESPAHGPPKFGKQSACERQRADGGSTSCRASGFGDMSGGQRR